MRDRQLTASVNYHEKQYLRDVTAPVSAMTVNQAQARVFEIIGPKLAEWEAGVEHSERRARWMGWDHAHWYWQVMDICVTHPTEGEKVAGLFMQLAADETGTKQLNEIAASAVRMGLCDHAEGHYSGGVRAVAGEYDDDIIFTCPSCGYKGA